jgi:hypothetical protein
MATSTSDMRLSGGHPALDFANTVDSRRGRWGPDFLRSFDDLLVLAERTAMLDSSAVCGLRKQASEDPERARGLVDKAVTLREALHQLPSSPRIRTALTRPPRGKSWRRLRGRGDRGSGSRIADSGLHGRCRLTSLRT